MTLPRLLNTEDLSKTVIRGRKIKPKVVVHHSNETNPCRCFVWLFKLYHSVCPNDRPKNANPFTHPKAYLWFAKTLKKLSSSVKHLCLNAGITGYKTIHTLRATAASRIY